MHGRKLWSLKESLAVFSLQRGSYMVHKRDGMAVSCMYEINEQFSVTRCLSGFISRWSRRIENHRKTINWGLHYMQSDGTISTTQLHPTGIFPNRLKSLSLTGLAQCQNCWMNSESNHQMDILKLSCRLNLKYRLMSFKSNIISLMTLWIGICREHQVAECPACSNAVGATVSKTSCWLL